MSGVVQPLNQEQRRQFLAARAVLAPRVLEFLNGLVAEAAQAGLDAQYGILAIADALIEASQTALELRQALLDAGGDADVAALLLGLKAGGIDAKSTPPPTVTRKRKRR